MPFPPVEVKVSGKLACFTRPEMKVERVSYEVMTPSAARGVLEAIFWKPEFSWEIREIRVLHTIRFFSIRRNEVNHRASFRAAKSWMEAGSGGYAADLVIKPEDHRAQRHSLCLRDVAYVIAADVRVKSDVDEDPAKYRDQFRRRVERGQCYISPYLGCREFAANFEPPMPDESPINLSRKLGRMLFDLEYVPDAGGRSIPQFFEAELEHGVLRVPAFLHERGR